MSQYLELRWCAKTSDAGAGVRATVTSNGARTSLGSETGQPAGFVFGVYRLAGLDGIECVEPGDLWGELRHARYP
jgi:hypothetical protein